MTAQSPTPDYSTARAAMVESQLRPVGVTDPAVLDAMASIEREKFVSDHTVAYVDRAVAIGAGRFLPPPGVLGRLLTQMMPTAGQCALVVGAGTGYSAAVLARMGLEVTAVESAPELAARAREAGVDAIDGPLEVGCRKNAPYDLILIDGAIEYLPEAIVDQLADGGRLGAALIERGISRLIIGRKSGEAFGYLSVADAGSPALPGFSRPRAFAF